MARTRIAFFFFWWGGVGGWLCGAGFIWEKAQDFGLGQYHGSCLSLLQTISDKLCKNCWYFHLLLCLTINHIDLIFLIHWDLTLFLFIQITFCLKLTKIYLCVTDASPFINKTAAYLKYIVIVLLYKFINYSELSFG